MARKVEPIKTIITDMASQLFYNGTPLLESSFWNGDKIDMNGYKEGYRYQRIDNTKFQVRIETTYGAPRYFIVSVKEML